MPRAVYRQRAQEALEVLSLVTAGDSRVSIYSGGMRRRLDLGASLMGRPPVRFLDELTTGLDPRTRNELWPCVEQLVAEGTTALLTTQYMAEPSGSAHTVVVINTGRIVAEGTSGELKDSCRRRCLAGVRVRWPDYDSTGEAPPVHGDFRLWCHPNRHGAIRHDNNSEVERHRT